VIYAATATGNPNKWYFFEIYENEKAKLGNVTPNDAYNQIGNGLFNNKVNEERTNIINRIIEEYKIDDLVKENLEEK